MVFLSLLALANGILIGLVRVVNGRLTISKGPVKSSFWNHLVGFILLTGFMLFSFDFSGGIGDVPVIVFFGGVIGALYVAVNSYIVPKLGATMATLMVISGQLIASTAIDVYRGILVLNLSFDMLSLGAGIILIAIGVYSSFLNQK